MTTVRFILPVASAAASYADGEIATIDSTLARQWAASGIAEAISNEPSPALVTHAAPTAVKRTRK